MAKKKEIVRLHNSLINGVFSLSIDAKKLLLVIWLHSNLKENNNIVKIYQKDVQNAVGIDIMHLNPKHREEIIEELMTKIITIRDIDNPNNFAKFQLLRDTFYKDGLLKADISPNLLPYIKEAQEKLFTRFNIQNIKPMRSGYAIRIYLMCKQFEDTGWAKIKLEDFKKQFDLEYKYKRMYDLKKYVLDIAKKQINENTDIIINYELEKKGRKYTNIKFRITPKNIKEIEAPAGAETKPKSNNWNDWRKELLNKGNLIIKLDDETFKLKNNYLFKNDKLLSSENSLEIWKNLYENRDKLQIINEDEYLQEQIKEVEEQENKYNKIKGLKEKYNYLIVKISEEHKEVSVTDIQFEDNAFKLYMSILGEQKTIYQPFENLEELEKFLKICSNSYLQKISNF